MRQPNIGNRIRPDEKCRPDEIIPGCRSPAPDARRRSNDPTHSRGPPWIYYWFVIGSMEFADALCPQHFHAHRNGHPFDAVAGSQLVPSQKIALWEVAARPSSFYYPSRGLGVWGTWATDSPESSRSVILSRCDHQNQQETNLEVLGKSRGCQTGRAVRISARIGPSSVCSCSLAVLSWFSGRWGVGRIR